MPFESRESSDSKTLTDIAGRREELQHRQKRTRARQSRARPARPRARRNRSDNFLLRTVLVIYRVHIKPALTNLLHTLNSTGLRLEVRD